MGETKQRRPLRMTAKIHEANARHAVIGVWQNGGKAGELTVDVEMAERVVERINAIDDTVTAPDTPEAPAEDGTCLRAYLLTAIEDCRERYPDIEDRVVGGTLERLAGSWKSELEE